MFLILGNGPFVIPAGPATTVSIIGHSHGGTVAFQAARLLDAPARSRVRVLTLATPFLSVGRRRLTKLEEWLFLGLRIAAVAVLGTLFVYLTGGVLLVLGSLGVLDFIRARLWHPTVGPLVLFFGTYTLLILAIIWPVERASKKWRSRVRRRIARVLDGGSAHCDGPLDLLCLRTLGDEASLAIGFAEALAAAGARIARILSAVVRFPQWVWSEWRAGLKSVLRPSSYSTSQRVLGWALLGYAVVLLVMTVVHEIWVELPYLEEATIVGIVLPLAAMYAGYVLTEVLGFLLFPFVFMITAILLLPFGSDVALAGPWVLARAGTTPEGGPWRVEVLPVDAEARIALRHAMHQEPVVIERVRNWLCDVGSDLATR